MAPDKRHAFPLEVCSVAERQYFRRDLGRILRGFVPPPTCLNIRYSPCPYKYSATPTENV
jgi:hypothetical protein